jgi:hypothetical protein
MIGTSSYFGADSVTEEKTAPGRDGRDTDGHGHGRTQMVKKLCCAVHYTVLCHFFFRNKNTKGI